MSFLGGGSDIYSYYSEFGGAVISTSIDKYIYIVAKNKFDKKIRLNYSQTEEVDRIDDIAHPIFRETLRLLELTSGIQIASMADIPGRGTGLGSSSAFTVGLVNALSAMSGKRVSKSCLSEMACEIEINKCKDPIGKQDQYAAAYGGINIFRFNPNGSVSVEPIKSNPDNLLNFEKSLIMFYTGRTRFASEILAYQSQALKLKSTQFIMHELVKLVFDFKSSLEGGDLVQLGGILDAGWVLKKQLAPGIADTQIDEWYELAMAAGAYGGKLLGAGYGGFLVFCAPQERHPAIEKKLNMLQKVNFCFDRVGSKIILDEVKPSMHRLG